METLSLTEPSADLTRIIRCSEDTLRDNGTGRVSGFATSCGVGWVIGGVRDKADGREGKSGLVKGVRCLLGIGVMVDAEDFDGTVSDEGDASGTPPPVKSSS